MTMQSIAQSLSYEQQSALLSKLLNERTRRQNTNKLRFYKPYAKQREFHRAGATHSERLFMAGNQLGKTVAGGAEWAMHLTGRYPDWWEGATFNSAPLLWAGSVTGESTRDNPQRILVGPPAKEEEWGTGFIPADCIRDRTRAVGVPNLLDTVVVRWGGGGDVQAGESILALKAYEKGREKWQGPTVDGIWFDEEPPEDIYSEGLTRTNNGQRGQFAQTTFTPLLGMSTVVSRFLMPAVDDPGQDARVITSMTIDDAEHYTPEERAKIIASYPAHEREARSKGIPSLGSGLIFPVTEEEITCKPFTIPPIWPQIIGVDFGYDHPFGAARLAWDRDNDIVYVTAVYRARQTTPIFHAAALKAWGAWIPVAWPHDGLQHDKGSGEALAAQYRTQGLNMLPERATWEDGGNGVEAGVTEMLDRMQSGRWKVFDTCFDWLEERRLYHRKDGKIVKERDDVLSASRYALMMLREAITTKPRIPENTRAKALARSIV
ncbi:DNA packaging protein [Mesorhizobium sp. M2D.F.Ca.ET.185.01.1.1]|uniref:terminase large subunit domain-containing protein n=3 Tax=Mesorhizobium TaxID=68287 RepID=UPI000FD85CE4|nr:MULTISPECIES: terminase family protein [unclassified Mesorhizobium]TGQ89448.1 DNA packaging protein [Mesorhizobium sp. M2D.F.Ca.ET.206.01.1.1]TGS32613.1 DNA packaging protein [Mesorhizobium sp. M2D.F.Ca.ET.185.01.1.1]TGU23703.1 DNA packaging protein [Mesorhizobium sp. M2D.F.Ca.ET.153.01.1.1]